MCNRRIDIIDIYTYTNLADLWIKGGRLVTIALLLSSLFMVDNLWTILWFSISFTLSLHIKTEKMKGIGAVLHMHRLYFFLTKMTHFGQFLFWRSISETNSLLSRWPIVNFQFIWKFECQEWMTHKAPRLMWGKPNCIKPKNLISFSRIMTPKYVNMPMVVCTENGPSLIIQIWPRDSISSISLTDLHNMISVVCLFSTVFLNVFTGVLRISPFSIEKKAKTFPIPYIDFCLHLNLALLWLPNVVKMIQQQKYLTSKILLLRKRFD